MINKTDVIDVCNEYKYPIFAVSKYHEEGIQFEGATDEGVGVTPIDFSEIDYINKKTSVFRTGLLRFDPEIEEEVYKQLNIKPSSNSNYLTKDEVKDIIINTNTDKLNKIIKITSLITIEKIRNMLIELNNEQEYDIPLRVYEVINGRYNEIAKGKSTSKLVVKKVKNEKSTSKTKKTSTKKKDTENKKNKK